MRKYILFGVLSILALILVACAPSGSTQQEPTNRSMEEDILAAEGESTFTGQAVQVRPQITYVKCVDTDGNNSYRQGNITGGYKFNGRTRSYKYTDGCWNNNQSVIEYTCQNNRTPVKVPIRCAAGCVNGACQRWCEDSDGAAEFVRGQTRGINFANQYQNHTDYCAVMSGGTIVPVRSCNAGSNCFVKEGGCGAVQGLTVNVISIDCPNGCAGGACVSFNTSNVTGPPEQCNDYLDNNADGRVNEGCAPYTCTDSDPADNPAIRGIINVRANNGQQVQWDNDYCWNSSIPLVQVYCVNAVSPEYRAEFVRTTNTTCINGTTCRNGICA